MKTQKKNLIKVMLSIVSIIWLTGCSEMTDDNSDLKDTGKIKVKMTDNMADFIAVNVDIKSVAIHYTEKDTDDYADTLDYADSLECKDKKDNDTVGTWFTLSTYAGIYNLLDFQDGKDTVLAIGDIPAGHVNQLRLILGDNNSIITAMDTFYLKVPSGMETGLKIKVNKEIEAGEELTLLFDFDAEKSIIIKGNGEIALKPVLKLMEVED